MKKPAAGGSIKPRKPEPLPEGVVGMTIGGKPVYDADWFDKRIGLHAYTIRLGEALGGPEQDVKP